MSLVRRKNAGSLYLFLCPQLEKVGSILVSACPYVWDIEYIVLKRIVWIPHGKIDAYFSELSLLVKLRPFEKTRDDIF